MISWPKFQRFVVAASVMLVSMFAMWWGIWMIGAAQYRQFIDSWIESRRALGYVVTYDSRDTEGFPRYITLHFSNFVLQNSDGIKVHANDVSLAAFPWQWERFNAKLKHGFDLTIPFNNDKTLYISTSETARNRTELDTNGDWKFVNLGLTNAKALWGTQPFFSAGKFEIAFDRPDTPPKDHNDAGLVIDSDVEQITLPQGMDGPFGPQASKLAATIRIMGAPPDPRRKDSVAAWNAAGGIAEFDEFFLQWGALIFSAKGTLGLDDDLQPEGVFSSQIGNHEEVLKTLMAADYIPKRDGPMLNSALNLFSKKSLIGGRSGIEVPITVQLGGLFLGPVRVFEFPEIEWDSAAQPPSTAPLEIPATPPVPLAPTTTGSPAK